MDDKKLKPWSIIIAILIMSLILVLYFVNPFKKDMGWDTGDAIFVCVTINLLLWAIPYFRSNVNLTRLIYTAVVMIVMGGTYFLFL